MGVIWGTTDLETAYNFRVLKDGIDFRSIRYQHTTINIPNKVGIKLVDSQPITRIIRIKGFIEGTNNADLHNKIIGLSDLLGAGWGPSNPVRGGTTSTNVQDLQIPGISYKYPCSFNGTFIVRFVGPRLVTDTAIITIEFIQHEPVAVV